MRRTSWESTSWESYIGIVMVENKETEKKCANDDEVEEESDTEKCAFELQLQLGNATA